MLLLKLILVTLVLPVQALGKSQSSSELTNFYFSPVIGEDHILFIFTNQAKSVKILLENEKWKPIPMVWEEKVRIWYLVYDKELKKGKYRYKLMVDNIIIADPLNKNKDRDEIGGYFSFFELKADIEPFKTNPKPLGGGYYEFRYKDLRAERVILTGSFNHWNPYEIELKREFGGMWRTKIFLPKGKHYYYFIVDDQVTPDPMNMKTLRDKHGNVVNILEVN